MNADATNPFSGDLIKCTVDLVQTCMNINYQLLNTIVYKFPKNVWRYSTLVLDLCPSYPGFPVPASPSGFVCLFGLPASV